MLRNPAYKGTACYGKTKTAARQRITRPKRLRGGIATRESAQERPRAEWIEIPVPAIIPAQTFALAEERLQANKRLAPRRTVTPSVVQGLVSCRKCGYALYRTSTRSTARRIYHYYRCLGSDAWRHLGGSLCDSRPVRQDLLDELVWREIIKLLEDPSLIQEELDRRLTAARNASPTKRREEVLRRELARIQKSMDRLMTAYQEDLISLDDLRRRMPELRKREQASHTELDLMVNQLADREASLRLAESLTSFLARLRVAAKTLDVEERQRVV
jgi:site-specific DNA recombinase